MTGQETLGGFYLLMIVLIFVLIVAFFSYLLVKVFRKVERSDRNRAIEREIRQQIIDRETERQIAIKLLRESGQL
jgi:uncharacterized membrane protein